MALLKAREDNMRMKNPKIVWKRMKNLGKTYIDNKNESRTECK
jgi:hypothetical protein